MPVWLIYALIILVTFRVTRFIIEDTFPPIGVPRRWLLNWWDPDDEWKTDRMSRFIDEHPDRVDPRIPIPHSHWGALGRSLRYLFQCPWCMSIYVGAGVIWIFSFYVSVPLPIAAWLATSALTGLIANIEDKLSS